MRDEETVIPTGGTVIEADDTFLVLADKDELARIQAILTPDQPAPASTA